MSKQKHTAEEIVTKLRGDKTVVADWAEGVNKKGVSLTPYESSAGKTRTCNPPVNSRMLHH